MTGMMGSSPEQLLGLAVGGLNLASGAPWGPPGRTKLPPCQPGIHAVPHVAGVGDQEAAHTC
jgi:hypothetical protein